MVGSDLEEEAFLLVLEPPEFLVELPLPLMMMMMMMVVGGVVNNRGQSKKHTMAMIKESFSKRIFEFMEGCRLLCKAQSWTEYLRYSIVPIDRSGRKKATRIFHFPINAHLRETR